MCFDNGKVAYCGNRELRVYVPSEAKKITSIWIIAYKELMGLKQLAAKVLENPEDMGLKGRLGQRVVKEKLKDIILTEISRRSGVPKDELEVEELGGKEEPDLRVNVTTTSKPIGIVEVKYVSNPENVGDFGEQLERAREQIQRYLNDPKWKVNYGIIVIISWSPGDILVDILPPAKVGEFNNPYIEYFSRGEE